MALSSTAIVLQTLNEKGLMKSDGGQASFSVLLFQDIAVIPMLALLPLLAMPDLMDLSHATDAHAVTTQVADAAHGAADDHSGGDHGDGIDLMSGLPGWAQAAVTLGAIGFVLFFGNYLTGPLFRFVSGAGLRELFTAAALMIVIGIAVLMSLVGLSPALGTFIAGVVLANSEYRHELESDIDPFKGLLLGLFFITVGAGVDFELLFANLGNVVGMTLGLMVLRQRFCWVWRGRFACRAPTNGCLVLGWHRRVNLDLSCCRLPLGPRSFHQPWPISCCWLWHCRCC